MCRGSALPGRSGQELSRGGVRDSPRTLPHTSSLDDVIIERPSLGRAQWSVVRVPPAFPVLRTPPARPLPCDTRLNSGARGESWENSGITRGITWGTVGTRLDGRGRVERLTDRGDSISVYGQSSMPATH